ncbi:AI-2E family transporter [Pseudoalteromonas agarivorans]|uniref:AI-2E family transporter n=1 Tax=Pseudoalteromonas agarivorans TaxID=176102 RepID=A0AAD0XD01_9GAMM|nr:AI-2E family transporter [Pseudoalteromonas agarivorans]AYM86863.1 AI-2E family transporter [Pseudoalteromonas agarivorans]
MTVSKQATPYLVAAASIIVIIAGLKVAAPLLVQLLMAFFIAIICMPSIRWMENHKIPRSIAIMIVLTVILAFVYAVVALVGDSINAFNSNKEFYIEQLSSRVKSISDWVASNGIPIENVNVAAAFEKADIMSLVTTVLGGVGDIFSDFFLIFLCVIFILAETTSFPAKFSRAFSNAQDKMVHVNNILSKIRHYLAIKAVTSLFTGILAGLALFFIGVDYPFLWGMLAFLLNFIPNLGSLLAAIPPLILALIQLGPIGVMWTGIGFFAINNFVGNYLEPKLMGKMLGLSAFVVLLSLILWGYIFGVVGMFLSVPLTMMIKIALDTNEKTRWLGILLGPEEEA